MFCMNCGKQIQDTARFCRYCGATQEDAASPSSPVSTSQLEDFKTKIQEIIVNGVIYGLENHEQTGFKIEDQSEVAEYALDRTDKATTTTELVDVVRHLQSRWPTTFQNALAEAVQLEKSINISVSFSTTNQTVVIAPPPQPQSEPVWETCEIGYNHWSDGIIFIKDYIKFCAEAVGPKGKYIAGETETLSGNLWRVSYSNELRPDGKDADKQPDAVNRLIKKLTSEGWESLPRGEQWFSYRFRRRVK